MLVRQSTYLYYIYRSRPNRDNMDWFVIVSVGANAKQELQYNIVCGVISAFMLEM